MSDKKNGWIPGKRSLQNVYLYKCYYTICNEKRVMKSCDDILYVVVMSDNKGNDIQDIVVIEGRMNGNVYYMLCICDWLIQYIVWCKMEVKKSEQKFLK